MTARTSKQSKASPKELGRDATTEYTAIEEHAAHRHELQEGAIMVAARPAPDHQDVLLEFAFLLRSQVPDHLRLLLEGLRRGAPVAVP